jgi:hypothetical protein
MRRRAFLAAAAGLIVDRWVAWQGRDGEGNVVAGRKRVPVTSSSTALWSELYGTTTGPLTVSGDVLVDRDVTVNGKLTVTGTIGLAPGVKAVLRVAGSVVLDGGSITVDQPDPALGLTVRIVGAVEADMLGAPNGTPDTDRGLWMQNGGRLNLSGAPRTRITRATGALSQGASVITVTDTTGWRVGDELVICPTEAVTVNKHFDHYDRPRVLSVSGQTVTLDRGLAWPHPAVTDPANGVVHTAEVANVTSNLVIEGDTEVNPVGPVLTDGRSFVHAHDGAGTSTLRNVTFRHLGPRTRFLNTNGTKWLSDVILGRYAVHFHRNGTAGAGTLIEDSTILDCGSRGFVPHGSHDITARRLVVHSCADAALWWDLEDPALDATERLLVEDCLFSRVLADPGGYKDAGMSGVLFSWGGLGADMPVIRRTRVVGVQGTGDSAGFFWPSQTNGTNAGAGNVTVYNNEWITEDCVAHNNALRGVQIWHNTSSPHVVTRMTCFRNGIGWKHGAYRNSYRVEDPHLFGNGIDLEHRAAGRAASVGPEPKQVQAWVGGWIGSMAIAEHQLPYDTRIVVTARVGALTVRDFVTSQPTGAAYDFVNTSLTPATITVVSITPDNSTPGQPGTDIRVQTGGQAWHYDADAPAGEPIPTFA